MTRVDLLEGIAHRGLARCYDPEARLFAGKLVLTPEGIRTTPPSVRYSAMAALGLHAAARRGLLSELPVDAVLARLVEHSASDELNLALITWAHAQAETAEVPRLLDCLDAAYRRVAGWYTCMGLAWSLAAAEHAARLGGAVGARASSLAAAMAADLLHYQHPRTALFGMRRRRLSRKLVDVCVEARVGTFACHSYAAYALSLHAARTGDPRAAQAARRCVEAVCAGQGKQGQWWWMVDTATGRWVDRYPVYAVHQDAMAPFCLHAAQPFADTDIAAHLRRGLDWLFGENELNESLVAAESDVVWRAIQRQGSLADGEYGVPLETMRRRRAVGLGLGFLARPPATDRLEVLRECRSYHLGWVLFARDALAAAEASAPGAVPAGR